MPPPKLEFDRSNFRLSIKFDFIIYPLDFAVLQKVLQKQGYQVIKSPGQRDLLTGGIIELDGTIAGKGDITVDSLGEKQVLGLNSKNAMDLIDAFELLQAGLSTIKESWQTVYYAH